MLPVKFEDLSGSTRLFLDFVGCRGVACDFYKYDFREISSYRTAAGQIDKRSYPRERLVKSIKKGLEDIGYSPRAEENLEKLSRPDSLVVFAGQQVGMLLGPMYTVIKALSSYKMAAMLEAELERPVIPCFWMATDDHDFDEVRIVRQLNRSGECLEISYDPQSPAAGAPMSDIRLDDTISDFLGEFEKDLIETEFSREIKEKIRGSYSGGRGISAAFADLFGKFLGEFGIVPVDPNFPGMKELFAPVFQREIENHREIFDLFEKESQRILGAGYHRQVHKSGESLNLFFNENGRANILHQNGKFNFDGRHDSLTKNDLLEKLESEPERFSPNVCLRPVAQCSAFPTVCQIVGPSEAAYFAQIRPIFDHLDVPWPVIRPRIFATVAEPHIRKTIEKLNIEFASLYNDTDREIGRVIKENFPSEIESRADSIRDETKRPLRELSGSLKDHDPESFQVIEHSLKRLDHELNHLFKRLFAAHKKRHDTAIGQVKRAAGFLFPDGKFQERVVTPVYFANKFGPGVFRDMERKLDIDSVDHQIVEI